MTARNFSNTAVEAELSTSVASGTTGFQVSAVTGFPSVPFTCVIAEGQADEEVILVTNLSGTTLTVTRGYNGTTAVAHSQGASLTHAAVAMDFQEANDHNNETTTAHGLTLADVITTTNTKTLTNKTIDGDSNTLQDIAASSVKNLPINAITSAGYTLVLGDARKHVTVSHASDQTLTIPLQASVTWLADARVPITNLGAGVWTIAISGGSGLNGDDLTIAQGESVVLLRTASDVWWCLPFSTGSAVPRGTISGTTGSPATSANGGATAYKWTADGGVTVDVAGFFDVLVVGGGGGGGRGYGAGGGAGGFLYQTSIYLPIGTHQVIVGNGGASGTDAATVGKSGNDGEPSALGPFVAPGGGGGGGYRAEYSSTNLYGAPGGNGGSGGGESGHSAGSAPGVGTGVSGFGYDGGTTSGTGAAGAGGGSSAVGANAAVNAGGAGGAGTANSITGASVTYAGGGGGSGSGTQGAGGSGGGGAGHATTGVAGTANTGGGGGGCAGSAAGDTGGAGGSGVVILLVGTV
ncbi:MAG: glycine-rich domain-containing protein [Burkholderiales bacterium]